MMRRQRAFTLIELLIALALVAVVLTLAAPSFSDFVLRERLKSINASLVTDLQFARSESVSRGKKAFVTFQSPASPSGMSCYTIFTDPNDFHGPNCDCSQAVGARCTTGEEIKTVQIPASLSVQLSLPAGQLIDFAYDPVTGGIFSPAVDVAPPTPVQFIINVSIDSPRTLQTTIGSTGRPQVCAPAGSTLGGGFATC